MFHTNDYVFYGSGGICKIVDIQMAPLDGMPKDKQYYILHSVHDQSSVMYIPVDNDRIFLRLLLSREEAEELMEQIPYITEIDETNSKLLREKYDEAMRKYQPQEWVRVIKTVHFRMNEPRTAARRISETERTFAETAKKHLYTELSLALNISVQQVEHYILECVEQK